MKTLRTFKWPFGIAVFIAFCGISFSQTPDCGEIAAIARMARTKSSTLLLTEKQKVGDSYRARVVFASRAFELRPTEQRNAILLLSIIPQNEGQHNTWMTLGDSLCSNESIADMKSLAQVGENLPHDLAKAVLLAPGKLTSYVAYAATSVQDPHSDYAIQMQAVCRVKHPEFLKAVEELPIHKRDWLVKHVLNPEGCSVLAFPEAE